LGPFAYMRDLNPQLDPLPEMMRIVQRNEGDRDAIANGIERLFDRTGRRHGYSLHSIHANTMTSLREENLGVLDARWRLTPFGNELVKKIKDADAFKKAVAKHLILLKGGLQFCRALQTVARERNGGYRARLAAFLSEKYQLAFWRDLNNISTMHNFLEWAGVCKKYRLNEQVFTETVGLDVASVKTAEDLSVEAASLLDALIRAGGEAAPGTLRAQTETLLGRPINPHSMPVFGKELEEKGLIELPRQRGSRTRPWQIKAAETTKIVSAMAAQLAGTRFIPDDAFKKTFGELIVEIKRAPKDRKGRALELLAARLCWRLGLINIEIRKLNEYEIDVRAEGTRPIFQKWIIQCKATQNALGVEVILREYGIAKLENIPVIAFVTTSSLTSQAREVAKQVMKWSNKVVLVFAQDELKTLAKNENALFDILASQSEAAREVKSAQKTVTEAVDFGETTEDKRTKE
jgi:hypothetical protein